MLCGKLPFFHEENEVMYEQILSGKFELPDFLSDNAKDLLSKLLEIDPKKRINFEEIKAHPWFATINKKNFMHKGININEDIIPIDEEIIQKMEKIGFNKMEIRYNILKNFHNKITTVYDLFLKQKIENGKKSVADLNSDLFDEYINDEKNKIKYYGSFEDALKSRISDGDEKLDRLPNYYEDKYDNKNENIIVADSGSVIERLIKRGKFTYDEENMCINKVSNINSRKENKKEIINDDDGDSKFKTISQMNNKPKKTEKKIEEITKEIMDVKNNFVKKEKTKSPKLSLKKSKIKNLTKSEKIE
jgi:serine/threonine protein kinase